MRLAASAVTQIMSEGIIIITIYVTNTRVLKAASRLSLV